MSTRRDTQPLRIWPLWLLLSVIVATRFAPRLFEDAPVTVRVIAGVGPLASAVLILLWWLAASRATWRERLAGLAGVLVFVGASWELAHSSMRGPATALLTAPMGMAGFAVGALAGSRIRSISRTTIIMVLAAGAFGFTLLLRNEGMSGGGSLALTWRWTMSPEEVMLADREVREAARSPLPSAEVVRDGLSKPEWPGFRGPDRTGSQRGPKVSSDWDRHPPELLWKTRVGPAWSSFAVAGDLLFTQEQRGLMETVVCYHADTGGEVWTQEVESRFEEALGGPGPRATPTLVGGGLFVTGAEGLLLRLDPKTGNIIWKQDLRVVAKRAAPTWGFASSPLVVESVVIVFAGGAGDRGTLAFDVRNGHLRWATAAGDHSYSSPQLGRINGEDLVLMLTNGGLDLLNPSTGAVRLTYEWQLSSYRVLQPRVLAGDRILLPSGMNKGTRCIRVSREAETLSVEELWTSRRLKPDFNDFVVYQGHAFGFDSGIFACVNLETGQRAWKGGRYGKGQVLLLENSGVLLVVSEQGEVVLLKADPEARTELARLQALEGKTWNHPVVVRDRLYLRNAQEAACYRLTLDR